MKLDAPANDSFDDDITAIGDEFVGEEVDGPVDEEFAPALAASWDSSDSDYETFNTNGGFSGDVAEGPAVSECLPLSDDAWGSSDADVQTWGPLVEEHPNCPDTAAGSEIDDKSSGRAWNYWDPLGYEDELASPYCVSRVLRDLLDLTKDPLTGVYIAAVEHDITRFHVLMVGPSGTPYEGGFFHFLVQCPPEYPMQPPRVRLMNTDDETVSFNPNIYDSGRVCLDMLGTSNTPGWSPAYSISSVLVSIQSLLTDKPYFNDPYWSSDDRPQDCEAYSHVVEHETIRVAVCDAIEACLNGSSLCTPHLREVMLNLFMLYYDKYEKAVESKLELTGTDMRDPLFFQTYERGDYQYQTLLLRLRKLKGEVEALIKARGEDEQ
ncbi:hypothetical protein HPB52_020967 [Rhipicephalus sanguineus]|uniref:Ubiquitin-conjugating enzyme E2 Z n=1 Tax=Rhipicephalus sanguineus TaxID=34632 RepID=A0A9D4T039_RHISA|nr:hypothetical protein HPB52_020967 [Rhipicephalus sanguineus]